MLSPCTHPACRVNDVEQLLCVDALAGGEHDHLKQLRHPLHEGVQVRPLLHVDQVLLQPREVNNTWANLVARTLEQRKNAG
jgi:hypothetical protein